MMILESSINNLDRNFKLNITGESLEIVVIEENKLSNMLLSQTFDSMVKRICNLKNFPLKFSSFKNMAGFLSYLKNNEFGKTKLMIFSDYSLEKGEHGMDILNTVEQKEIDATIIVMSDSDTKERSTKKYLKKPDTGTPKKKKNPMASS